MTFGFVSEKGAEEFIDFIGEKFGLECEVESFLQVDVDERDLPNWPEVLDEITDKAQQLGAEDVLI